jgi:glycosyltransferase involved in cell wall biosynthesis
VIEIMQDKIIERAPSPNIDVDRLKVLYIYKDFDIYNGLIETFLILSKYQVSMPFDFEVCVFKNRKNDHAKVFRENGGRLTTLKSKWGSNPLIIFKLYKLFKIKRPDIVQTFVLKPNLYGIIAALLAKVPIIVATDLTLKDQAPTRLRRLRDKFLYKIYVSLANKASHVLCVSEAGRRELIELGIRTGISVIYPPLDIDKLKNSIDYQNGPLYMHDQLATIGIIARLSEEKCHADLFEAFAILLKRFPAIKLLIVGDGPLRRNLEVMTQRLAIHESVKFVGFQKDIHLFLRKMDIFVLPSRTEALGIAILEAMAFGLPVVAARVGGIPEIVDNQETGLLYDPGNVGQLCSALAQLIEAPEKRKLLGENGKKKAHSSFHPDRFIMSHFRLYLTLMDKYRLPNLADITKSAKKEST